VADSAVPNTENPGGNSRPAGYTSMMLEFYFAKLGSLQSKRLLDLGPVCAENIMFFAHQVKKFYVCDLFLRFARNQSQELPEGEFWGHLDYAPQSFDGIHLWDFIDHLTGQQAATLVKKCHRMLMPGGKLLITAFDERFASATINSFVIGQGYQITLRPQFHLDLPWNYRSNRTLALLMTGFPKVKSFLYRNGIRELLFQRD